ncbi:hypothetical protein [Pseudomonas sputi]|uniref:hypothetical protein n=1 Tax=Pseudomonas sputi TaxID=2892325 RepID=UPI001F2AC747|nr:hypothetical protein [Pseudomonas sputi]
MTTLKFYLSLREEILKNISGVENSHEYYSWDDTSPNWLTKSRLDSLLEKYILIARNLGVYIVTRYANCDNPKHEWYPTTNRYGIKIPYQDERFVWAGEQLYQGDRFSTCPCSPKNQPHKNWVIDDIIYDKKFNAEDCETIALILQDVKMAVEKSGDKKVRSGIREYLLRAVLRINDAILPKSVDDYIAEIRAAL